jgi:SAP domain-containing ribonucleoprotein
MSDFASMKVADLKNELKTKGLPVTGNKQELVERLQQAESAALLDDDLDQDDQISEEAIKAAEEELKKQTDLNTSDEPSPAKKPKPSEDKENKIEAIASPVKTVDGTETDEKTGTITSPSMEEAILKRKERFGGFQSEEARKVARAERFGVAAAPDTAGKKASKIGDAPPVDIDILKKRAERFGSTVSPHVKQAEVSEAIKKRQERFGVVTKSDKAVPAVKTNVGTNSVILNEQMQKRKERFNL